MRYRAMLGGMAALVAAMAVSAFGQHGVAGAEVEPASALTKAERIAQAVAELNAQAVEPIGGERFTGRATLREPWDGVAARTVWNDAAERGIGGCSIDVAVVGADNSYLADVVAKISADPRMNSVTSINSSATTPTVATLRPFDAVFAYTNTQVLDPVALGDALAGYVDNGGGLVMALAAMAVPFHIQGRLLSDDYYCIEAGAYTSYTPSMLGTVHVPGSLVMQGVTTFNGGAASYRPLTSLHPRATRVASWSTGEPLVATRVDLAGRRVDLGMFPPSSDAFADAWTSSTDGARLMANALVYASGCPGVGLFGCGSSLYRQGPNVDESSWNSNTPANIQNAQAWADDFTLPGGGYVHQIALWGTWFGSHGLYHPPIAQRFVVNIHRDAGGVPGPIVYTATVNVEPEWIGDHNADANRVYRFEIKLPTTFEAAPGQRYWLSPLGDDNPFTWSWQQRDSAANASAFRNGGGAWNSWPSNMAFELCGFCDCLCPGDADWDGDVDLDDLQILLFWFGSFCL
ncbi:MAG: hypothetical protein KDA20_07730 [Phycisphaerales bacterium]|nr:hypothetical protein [Phycisphaerales bacterium]